VTRILIIISIFAFILSRPGPRTLKRVVGELCVIRFRAERVATWNSGPAIREQEIPTRYRSMCNAVPTAAAEWSPTPPQGCKDAGGTWFAGSPSDYGLTSDWSPNPNSSLAGFVSDWTDSQGGGYNLGYNGLVTQNEYTYFLQNGTTSNQPFLPALAQAGQIASPQNIFELWGFSVLTGACGGVGGQACTAVLTAGALAAAEIFGNEGPSNIHVPSEGPTGQEGPEQAPISGPPGSGPPVP
jgi:hypothetical protein